MKSDFAKYKQETRTQTTQLSNEIAQLKQESENIDDEKNRLKSQEQENSQKQSQKITELGKILMAIDHLEGFCKFRKLDYSDTGEGKFVGLNYDAISMQIEPKNDSKN